MAAHYNRQNQQLLELLLFPQLGTSAVHGNGLRVSSAKPIPYKAITFTWERLRYVQGYGTQLNIGSGARPL